MCVLDDVFKLLKNRLPVLFALMWAIRPSIHPSMTVGAGRLESCRP